MADILEASTQEGLGGSNSTDERNMKMLRKSMTVLFILAAVFAAATPAFAQGRGHGALGTIYVTSQGLYYDTFVTNETLPMQGDFQQLVNHTTEFGPGDPGYLGGRWWVDTNGNGIQDAGDTFFHCPLLGPGRTSP